jgi:organic hydroperoxide reductase OsmC/OhrA
MSTADKQHHYAVTVTWTGNQGTGTSAYRAYSRDHLIEAGNKPAIAGSSDPSFRGDVARWNPEELLLASLSACHKLWYLGLCAGAGVVVTDYQDAAEGWMLEHPGGEGQFTRVLLRPTIALAAGADVEKARHLHHDAHEKCFIARSVNFPVEVEPVFVTIG